MPQQPPLRRPGRKCQIRLPRRLISPQHRANSTPQSRRPRRLSSRLGRSAKFSSRRRRAAIEPDLPPDHPLEPGTRPLSRTASPSERIAASESAISEISPGTREQASTSSFIAAARRAAQAAAAQPAKDNKTKRAAPLKNAAGDPAKGSSTITSKIRSLLVGASVVVIVLGTFKMAMTLLDSGTPPSMPASEISSEPAPSAPAECRARGSRAGHALADLADADRPAIAQCTRAERPRQHGISPDPAACRDTGSRSHNRG